MVFPPLDDLRALVSRESVLVCLAGAGLSFFVVLVLVRSARLRKWRAVLTTPADRLSERRGRWKARLPSGISLETKATLFEVLYDRFRAKPKLVFAEAEALEASQDGADALSSPGGHNGKEPSDDDQANQMVDLGHYHQNARYLPTDSVVSTWLKNLLPVVKGKKKLKTGVEHAVLDSLGPGGGLAGAKAGEALGLAAAPLLAGLAGYALPVLIVLGALAGSAAGRKMGARVRARRIHAAAKKVRVNAKLLKRNFVGSFPALMRQLEAEHRARAAFARAQYRGRQRWLVRAFFPDLMTTFLRDCLKRLERDRGTELGRWKQVLRQVRRLGPVEFVAAMERLSSGRFLDDPELLVRYEAFSAAVRELQEAQKEAMKDAA